MTGHFLIELALAPAGITERSDNYRVAADDLIQDIDRTIASGIAGVAQAFRRDGLAGCVSAATSRYCWR